MSRFPVLVRRVPAILRVLTCLVAAALVATIAPVVEASGYITFHAVPGSLGAIPDGLSSCPGAGTPRNVIFNVSGLTGTVRSVRVTFTATHAFLGDLGVTVISPNVISQTVFSRTGATTPTGFGDSSNLAGPYTFSDTVQTQPAGGWWQAAFAANADGVVPSGVYRSTQPGPQAVNNSSPATDLSAPFVGAAPNGVWTLRFVDNCLSDTGTVSAASIEIATSTTGGARLVDYDGDGVTDFTIARPTGGTATWFTQNSLGLTTTVWGNPATDFMISGDYDGDGKSDVGVWRPGAPSAFWIRRSSDGGLTGQAWGSTGDDPAVPGDYDGDGKTDFAVYRCPPFGSAAGQCYFYVLRSSNGAMLAQPWGFGVDGDYFAAPGDYDGDGRADFAVQTAMPGNPTAGIFYILYAAGGSLTVQWGNSSDFVVPGDYDGDGKTDIAVRRTVSGTRQYWVRRSSDGGLIFQQWGSTGDVSVPGDYDGDGKTDFAIWRGSATPGQSAFWVRRSSDGSVLIQQWGHQGDFPVAGFIVH